MNSGYMATYMVIAIVLTMVDLVIAYQSFQKTEEIGRFLCLTALFSGIITLSYLLSLCARSYFVMSLMSSVYFAGIDWMLVSLIHFVYLFTEMHRPKHAVRIRKAIRWYAGFDTAVLFLNVFREIAVSYIPQGEVFAIYAYQMKPLYVAHLIFDYAVILLMIYILFDKHRKTPRQYRHQYSLIVMAIALVVVINAFYLYQDSGEVLTRLDYSVFGYSAGLVFLYWAAFSYRYDGMLKSLSMMIIQNIDQGIVLFDYMDDLILYNHKAEQLLPDIEFDASLTNAEFRRECSILETEPEDPDPHHHHHAIPCDMLGSQQQPLHCNFSPLHDSDHKVIGSLFVFSDVMEDLDAVSGFQRWEVFFREVAENPDRYDHPTALAIFDIVGLGEINRTFGHEVGDQRIRNLGRIIRKNMPEGTHFVRGYEAHLLAVCSHCTEADLKENVDRILESSAGTVLYAMSSTLDSTEHPEEMAESRNIMQAIDIASRALDVKKLLSSKSIHSQALASLVRALEESDSDTEAHVQRTQKMGATLGERIGLSDAQQADLALLCLLHDIGKIGIPLEILNKPGKLTPQEWSVLRTHPEKGYQIAMSSEELKPIAKMILSHHERWDGEGYPEGLAGPDIPLLSRMISIVDSYDAMVNDRSYRKGLTPEEAQEEIRRQAGKQFDPVLAEKFLAMLEENPDIARGEQTNGREVRVFIPADLKAEETGNTFQIPYSRYILDLDEMIIETDERFEEITGYSAKDAVGTLSQFDLIPPEDRAYYMVQVNDAFTKGNIAYLKHEIVRKDGTKCWVVCYGKRYYDSAEKEYRSEILIFRSTGGEDA